MRLFSSLRDDVATAVKASPATAVFRSLASPSQAGRPYRDSWDTERAVREGMQRMVWVFRSVHVRAMTSAKLPIVVRRGSPTSSDLVEDHPLLPLLNAYPNDEQSKLAFRYCLSAQVDLSRMGAFVEVLRDRIDRPVALRLLPAGAVAPVPGSKGNFLDGYELRVQGFDPVRMDPRDVVWVKYPHPTNPYSGMTPLEAAGIAVDTEWAAKLFQRNFLANDARGGGFLIIAGDVRQGDIDAFQAKIDSKSGPTQAGRIHVLEGTADQTSGQIGGVSYVPTGTTPRDADYLELRKFGRDEILGTYGMPESKATANASQRTFENASVEDLTFYRDTMGDHCALLDDPFDRIDGDATTFVTHDFSSIGVLQRDRIEYESHLLELRKDGDITWDEFREATGRDPYASGGGRVYIPIAMQDVAGAALVDVAKAATKYSPDQPRGDDGRFSGDGGGEFDSAQAVAEKYAQEFVSNSGRNADYEISESMYRLPQGAKTAKSLDAETVVFGPYTVSAKRLANKRSERLRQVTAWEKQARSLLRSLFDRQAKAVLAKLNGAKCREGTRHWRNGHASEGVEIEADGTLKIAAKVIGASDIFDRGKWDEQLKSDVTSLLEAVIEHFGSDAYETVMSTVKDAQGFDPNSPRLTAYLAARGNKIVGVNDTTFDAIESELAAGEEAGETIAELAGRVTTVFEAAKGYRSETIARTEVMGAMNAASLDGAKQTGAIQTKTWLATEDERTRETHAEADGQTVGIDELFEVGDEQMDAPGDPDADPSETLNCRCTLTYSVDGEDVLL